MCEAGAAPDGIAARDLAIALLTDLRAASAVLGVTTEGVARPLVVGRVKIEVRPLRLIEVVTDTGTELNVFLQDDWHVRVFGADGQPKNLTDIREGDRLTAFECEAGRHTGIKIDETIDVPGGSNSFQSPVWGSSPDSAPSRGSSPNSVARSRDHRPGSV